MLTNRQNFIYKTKSSFQIKKTQEKQQNCQLPRRAGPEKWRGQGWPRARKLHFSLAFLFLFVPRQKENSLYSSYKLCTPLATHTSQTRTPPTTATATRASLPRKTGKQGLTILKPAYGTAAPAAG